MITLQLLRGKLPAFGEVAVAAPWTVLASLSCWQQHGCRSPFHPNGLLGTTAGEPHIPACLHHSNKDWEQKHRYECMHLLCAKLRKDISSSSVFEQIWLPFLTVLLVCLFHCCNVLLFRNVSVDVIKRLQSSFGLASHLQKKERMLHIWRASRYSSEKPFETNKYPLFLICIIISILINCESQEHQRVISI